MRISDVIKLVLVLIGFQLLISALFKFIGIYYEINEPFTTVIGINLSIFFTILYYKKWIRIRLLFNKTKVKIKPVGIVFILSLSMVIVFNLIDLLIIRIIPKTELIEKLIEESKPNSIYSKIHILFLAPVMEEMLFRGLILTNLFKRYNPTKSILICSVFFSFFHLNPYALISTFLGGILIGYIYYKFDNIFHPVFFHFIYNLAAYLINTNEILQTISVQNILICAFCAIVILICFTMIKTSKINEKSF
jgi:uncharacterized protein